ncbi:leishmanolysin-like peptidase 2 [Gracilinanus agilis]|uniref:leishmanolysin-like peptidase 2 n=1 Tax=Gracilinanus agilis TaxID=191870 RepID=UPI001CFDAA13|nr:leishmanolysin-like peptidase 2 [Gracilinanus agilis]
MSKADCEMGYRGRQSSQGRNSLLLVLLLLFLKEINGRCLHEEIQKSVRLLQPSVSPLSLKQRSGSLSHSSAPSPIRIRVWYPKRSRLKSETLFSEGDWVSWEPQIDAVLRDAIHQIQRVLAVLPVRGPLLLSRDPEQYCQVIWRDPDSSHHYRCSLLNPGYMGENCLGVEIPDTHLRGYSLWPEQGSPELIQPDGLGIPDTDFLLYVQVTHTLKCHHEPSIIAYSACCQLDVSDRPLAGTIIFCAPQLTSLRYNHNDIVMATIHELFHSLGFSGKLFKKWRDCTIGTSTEEICSPRQQVTRRDEWGQLILTTPTVSHSLARHLGVSEALQGVPLEEEGPSSSHWEARLLQGSVMTATFDSAHRTKIDPITLAAFADSGWYQVNHSAAQELLWGQGSGLNFGLVTSCRSGSSDFFCVGSGLGCHYLHFDKGHCSSDPLLEGCRMYKPLANRSECWKKGNAPQPNEGNPHGEIYHPKSRCFIANLTSVLVLRRGTFKQVELTGRCYLHRCTEGSTFYVRAAGSPWVPCLPGKPIQVPGYYGLLFCPWGPFCQANKDLMALPSSTTSPSSPSLLIQLDLGLAGPPGYYLSKMQQQELTQSILQALVIRAGVHMCHFHRPSINSNLVFTVHMWTFPGCQGPPSEVLYRSLSQSLNDTPLNIDYGGATFTTDYSR